MDLKYKQKRKLVEFTCDYCNSKNTKPESEFKRNIKLGRHNFCSRNTMSDSETKQYLKSISKYISTFVEY